MAKIRGVKPDYWTDEDVVELSIAARLLFIGLWTYACDNGHLQDKPKQIKMRILPGDEVSAAELLGELETGGRIVRRGGWITIPNFAKHQRPDRRYWQTCALAGCAKPGDSQPETRGVPHEPTPSTRGGLVVGSMGAPGDGDGEVKGSDGDGDGDESGQLTLADATRDDVVRICDHLAARIESNGATRPSVTTRWIDAARLMIDRDGRTEQEIHGAIDWCQDDEFWRGNVLSLPKLRSQYDTLRLHALRRPRSAHRQQETDKIFAQAAKRMGISQ